jgi:hypothetical protein
MLDDNQRLRRKICSLDSLDTVLRPLRPMMRSRDHSQGPSVVVELVERLDGHRKYAERLAVLRRGAVLLPSHAVSDQEPFLRLPSSQFLLHRRLVQNIPGGRWNIFDTRGREL